MSESSCIGLPEKKLKTDYWLMNNRWGCSGWGIDEGNRFHLQRSNSVSKEKF